MIFFDIDCVICGLFFGVFFWLLIGIFDIFDKIVGFLMFLNEI